MTIPQGGVYDITIYQGADYSQAFQLFQPDGVTPIPLTGYTAKAQIRLRPGDTGLPIAEFTATVTPATGIVTLSLTEVQTAALVKEAVYDVFLTGADSVLFLQGTVTIDKRVTIV